MSKECRELFSAITHAKKRAFLMAYIELPVITKAAEAAGVSRAIHLVWKRVDPDYAEAFALAQELAAETLEDEATRRALGWKEIRYDDNGQPYEVPKHSDVLMIFRLKGEMSKYQPAAPIIGYSPEAIQALIKKVVDLVGPSAAETLAAELQRHQSPGSQ